MRKPPQRKIARGRSAPAKAASSGKRNVYYGGRFHLTPTFRRDALVAGNKIKGPALIEEYASTTVLMPGDTMEVDALGKPGDCSRRTLKFEKLWLGRTTP